MSILLQLNTSIFSADGQSSHLADEYVAGWRARHSKGRVIIRDFARDPVPHLTATGFQAFLTKPAERSTEQQAEVAFSDMLIDELKQADVIVIGLPMYNFGVPSMLKAYFDHIARAGVTFRYSDKGPEGLLTGKKVYVFATRGGLYVGRHADYVHPGLPALTGNDGYRVCICGRSQYKRSRKTGGASAGERRNSSPLRI